MNNLTNSKVYLCGQVEYDPKASGWRNQITQTLKENIKPIQVWDPLVKPDWMSENSRHPTFAFNKQAMFESHDSTTPDIWATNLEIRKVCKKLASRCDWMIARITKTFTWGSIDELEIAARDQIPVFLWMPDGPVSTYGIPGIISNPRLYSYYVHKDINTLIQAIMDVHNGTSPLLELDPFTWMFLTYSKGQ